MPYRNGQWLAFDDGGLFAGCFRARSGKAVGIFHDDGTIHIVAEDGTNFTILRVPAVVNIANFHPSSIEWATDRRDIPYERIKHLPADWQPTP